MPIRGEAGLGYVLEGGFDLPPLMLTSDEIEAAALGARWVQSRGDIDKIDRILAQPGYFEAHPDSAAQAAKTRALREKQLAEAEEAWLEASAELESATQPA